MSNIRNKSSKIESNLDKPQYNSTLKLINKLDQLQTNHNKAEEIAHDLKSFKLDGQQMERINEKASTKLNMRGQVFGGLVSVDPDEEDFLKFLGNF